MNKSTLKALKGSIQKWHDIAYHDGEDLGTENCPLCQKFFIFGATVTCYGCPIQEHTGRSGCYDTPYTKDWHPTSRDHDYIELLYDQDPTKEHAIKLKRAETRMRAAAVKELKFLVTLMPVGESAPMTDGDIWYCAEQ